MGKRTKGFRCFECGGLARHAHHVVPFRLGGTRTLPLCEKCHELAHERSINLSEHVERVKRGIEEARRKGKKIGGVFKPIDAVELTELYLGGVRIRHIADYFEVNGSTIYRRLKGMGLR